MDGTTLAELERRLLGPAGPARFDPGTPLHTAARLRMRGSIRVGRWLPFRAREVLGPQRGEFFRYRITALEPSPSGPPPARSR